MSRRDYPRIGGVDKAAAVPMCACCSLPAHSFIRVQFTWMRGDDEIYGACEQDLAVARADLSRFLDLAEHWKTRKTRPAPPSPPRTEEQGQAICGSKKMGEYNMLHCCAKAGHVGDHCYVVSPPRTEEQSK